MFSESVYSDHKTHRYWLVIDVMLMILRGLSIPLSVLGYSIKALTQHKPVSDYFLILIAICLVAFTEKTRVM